MKTRVLVTLSVVLGVMSAAQVARAGGDEVKECFFKQRDHHKEEVKCKVRLVEDDHRQLASRVDSILPTPIPTPKDRCERVRLDVDCDCDFQLHDDYATQFDKHGDEFNVGSERGKLAVLVIKDEAKVMDGGERGQKAVLTISGERDHDKDKDDSFALRLEGECKGY